MLPEVRNNGEGGLLVLDRVEKGEAGEGDLQTAIEVYSSLSASIWGYDLHIVFQVLN